MRVTLEEGAVAAVAAKTNPGFGGAFPKATEASFKESKGDAEKVAVGGFGMGSYGLNEVDMFVPSKSKQ